MCAWAGKLPWNEWKKSQLDSQRTPFVWFGQDKKKTVSIFIRTVPGFNLISMEFSNNYKLNASLGPFIKSNKASFSIWQFVFFRVVVPCLKHRRHTLNIFREFIIKMWFVYSSKLVEKKESGLLFLAYAVWSRHISISDQRLSFFSVKYDSRFSGSCLVSHKLRFWKNLPLDSLQHLYILLSGCSTSSC